MHSQDQTSDRGEAEHPLPDPSPPPKVSVLSVMWYRHGDQASIRAVSAINTSEKYKYLMSSL